jgi:hypothetical protein
VRAVLRRSGDPVGARRHSHGVDGAAELPVPVDRESEELETLAEWVELVKGSCSFAGDIRRFLEQPESVESLEAADLIYAVDGATGERCGLFYGDPATESLPIHQLKPWLAPAVMEVPVNTLSDDREVLAKAVRSIKGSCSYAPDLRKLLGDPEFEEELSDAHIICSGNLWPEEVEEVRRFIRESYDLPAEHLDRIDRLIA